MTWGVWGARSELSCSSARPATRPASPSCLRKSAPLCPAILRCAREAPPQPRESTRRPQDSLRCPPEAPERLQEACVGGFEFIGAKRDVLERRWSLGQGPSARIQCQRCVPRGERGGGGGGSLGGLPFVRTLASSMWLLSRKQFICTCGLVAMTSASHAECRQFDPGPVHLHIWGLDGMHAPEGLAAEHQKISHN